MITKYSPNSMTSLLGKNQVTVVNSPRNWSVRTYREGDERQILELWKAAYPGQKYDQERWMRWWRWMYMDNPGNSIWIGIAAHDNEIVGQQALIPFKIKVNTKVVTGFQAINALTHPDYRGQGIYKKVMKEVIAEASNDGASFGFTFPNDNSYPIAVKKLNWIDIAPKRKLVKVLNWDNVLKTRISNKFFFKVCTIISKIFDNTIFKISKVRVGRGLSITKVSCFDERINEFWARVYNQFPIMVVKSKDYLNWRYANVPDVNYSIYIAEEDGMIYGYIVVGYEQSENKNNAVIYDLMAESKEIAHFLISSVTDYCRRDGVSHICWIGIANKSYLGAFRKSGFFNQPFLKEGRVIAYLNGLNISKEFISNSQNWLVQEGDSDQL